MKGLIEINKQIKKYIKIHKEEWEEWDTNFMKGIGSIIATINAIIMNIILASYLLNGKLF